MTIEFHTPYGKVEESLISKIRRDMLELSHLNKKITRAEVALREESMIEEENRICEVRLNIYGENLFIHIRRKDFETASKDAVKELKRLVKEQVKSKSGNGAGKVIV